VSGNRHRLLPLHLLLLLAYAPVPLMRQPLLLPLVTHQPLLPLQRLPLLQQQRLLPALLHPQADLQHAVHQRHKPTPTADEPAGPAEASVPLLHPPLLLRL
jgi:hypothetical protein